ESSRIGSSRQPATLDERQPRLRRLMVYLKDRYPPLPPTLQGRLARICTALVLVLALAFVVFFTALMWARQDAYPTFAADLGIMDKAMWTIGQGGALPRKICNSLTDPNCLGDISRLAIHFEPILPPLALLYLVAPSPKTLLLFQAMVVASGAFPAYW